MKSMFSIFLSNILPVSGRPLPIGLFWNTGTWRTTTSTIQHETANRSALTATMQPDYARLYLESRPGHLREHKMKIINSMANGIRGSNFRKYYFETCHTKYWLYHWQHYKIVLRWLHRKYHKEIIQQSVFFNPWFSWMHLAYFPKAAPWQQFWHSSCEPWSLMKSQHRYR